MIFNTDSMFFQLLLLKPKWRLIYSDKVANIFVRTTPENQYIIDRYKEATPTVIEDKDNS